MRKIFYAILLIILISGCTSNNTKKEISSDDCEKAGGKVTDVKCHCQCCAPK